MNIRALILFLFCTPSLAFSDATTRNCTSPAGESAVAAENRLEREVLLGGLAYAREHSNPTTGFVEDTVGNYADLALPTRVRASISSTGFLMALVADLYLKKMVSYDEAYAYCDRPLTAVLQKKARDEKAAAQRHLTGALDPHTDISYRGWFAHFIDWQTGDRWLDANTGKGVEYATTDSTWFLAGGVVCAEVFAHTPVAQKFNKIFAAVDFHDLMIDGGLQKNKLTLSMSFNPDEIGDPKKSNQGYSLAQWHIYQHSWLVYLMGLAAPRAKFRLPLAAWSAWDRTGIKLEGVSPELDGQILYGNKRALFSHYFPDVFMPPQNIKEACHIDYFKNSQVATRFNRTMALKDSTSKTFRSGLWGLDAGPNPVVDKLTLGAPLTVGATNTTRYEVNAPYKRSGTACPACAVASAMFEPELVFTDLRAWCDSPDFGSQIWGKYGPTNGINLDYGWNSPYALSGIVGPMALSVANIDSATSVWSQFAKSKIAKRAVAAAARAPLPPNGCLIPE